MDSITDLDDWRNTGLNLGRARDVLNRDLRHTGEGEFGVINVATPSRTKLAFEFIRSDNQEQL